MKTKTGWQNKSSPVGERGKRDEEEFMSKTCTERVPSTSQGLKKHEKSLLPLSGQETTGGKKKTKRERDRRGTAISRGDKGEKEGIDSRKEI